MTEDDGSQPMLPLPGLEPAERKESELEKATRRTIKALHAASLLSERHSVICQLMLELAEAVDRGKSSGRASAAAMAAAQLRECYELLLPEASVGGEDDAWGELVADLRRSAAAVRDAP